MRKEHRIALRADTSDKENLKEIVEWEATQHWLGSKPKVSKVIWKAVRYYLNTVVRAKK